MKRDVTSLSLASTLVFMAVLSSGCLRERPQPIERISFADRLRLDRQALTDEQRAADITVGTFRDGSDAEGQRSTLVSEVFQANLPGRAINNLPLADCYWLASNPQGTAGDQVRLSWNGILELEPQDDLSSSRFGLCGVRDPETGVPIHQVESGLQPDPLAFPVIFATEPEEYPDFQVLGAMLTAHPATQVDRDSRCPGETELGGDGLHFDGMEHHVAGDASFLCVNRNGCEVSFCGLGCGYRPGQDQSLRLSIANELLDGEVQVGEEVFELGMDGTAIVPRWMKPNLMVVRGTRRLARTLAPISGQPGRFAWATAVLGSAEAGTRWHENFSSNVLVETARLVLRGPDGTEAGLSEIDGNRLLVRTPVATFECLGEPSPDGTVFELASGCRQDGEALSLVVTPTYRVAELSEVYGNPLTQPLRWEVAFQEDPLAGEGGEGHEVLIELNVRAEFGGAFLKIDPAGRDLGRRQIGTLVEADADVTNVGGKTLRITQVWLDGSAAADFDVAMPVDPRPVPVAVDVSWNEDGVVVEAGADWDDVPLLEILEDETQSLDLLRSATVDGESLQLYGEGVDVQGSSLYAHDPSADFTAWQPVAGEDRPISQTVWNQRFLPFDLGPGESFPIRLWGRPSQLGSLGLTLGVEAFDVTAPSVQEHVASAFRLESIPGPIPGLLPERMTILPDSPRQNLVVLNHGGLPLVRGFFEITGVDAARFHLTSQHPANATVEPGLMEWYQVQYEPICGYPYPSHVAELRVATDAGDLTLELVGISACEP